MPILFAASKLIYPELLEILNARGKVTLLEENPCLPRPESTHADMQTCPCGKDKVFVKGGISEQSVIDFEEAGRMTVVSRVIGKETYPECCSHNILLCGNYYFHNLKHTDPDLQDYLDSKGYIGIDVRQGYSGCSALYVDDLDLIITADEGIRKASSKHSFNCFFIEKPPSILLPGYDSGFIGGCLGYSKTEKTLYANGCLSEALPELYIFLREAGINVVEVKDRPLFDIGGIKCIVYNQ